MKILQNCLILLLLAASSFIVSTVPAYSQPQSSYIIVHCHNLEGKEINSIQGMVGTEAEIYDGDTFIGYGARDTVTHNQPIPIGPGKHTIKVKFNGMVLEQNITLESGVTEVLTFVFERRVWDFRSLLDTIGAVSREIGFSRIVSYGVWETVDLRGTPPYPEIHIADYLDLLNQQEFDDVLSGTFSCEMNINSINMIVRDVLSNPVSQRELEGEKFDFVMNSYYTTKYGTRYHSYIFEFLLNPPIFEEWYVQQNPTSNINGKAVIAIFPAFPTNKGFDLINATTYACFRFPVYMVTHFYVAIHDSYGYYYNRWDGHVFINEKIGEGFFTNDQVYVSSVPCDLTGTAVGDEKRLLSELGKPQDPNAAVGKDPINLTNGNLFSTHQDLFIPAKELPLQFIRTYNSQDDYDGPLGYGWTHNYNLTLTENTDGSVILMDEDARRLRFTPQTPGPYQSPKGNYDQLTKNPDGTYTLLRKHGRKLYFNTQGLLTRIEERNANAIDISRTPTGMITQVSDSSGRKLLFTHNAQGQIAEARGPEDKIFKYEYDSSGNLIKTIDPLNNETLYQYDNNYNLIHQTDANGHSLYFEYDEKDRAYHSWQDGNNNEITLSFDPDNKTTTVTDSLGNTTQYQYNYFGLVTKITDSQNNIQTFNWDANLNRTSATDQNGNTTTFSYDARGNLLSIKDPLNNTTTFTYEPDFDFVSSIIDALGNITAYSYDAKGNLTQVKDALNNTTNYSYNAQGQLIQVKDANNNITNFTYDIYGNLIQTVDALNNPTSFTYDIVGNVIQTTDAKGNFTNFTYDSLNRLTQITYPDQACIVYTYDAVGDRISITDPKGNTTNYAYDVVNRLVKVTDPLGNTTCYFYDTEGNRIRLTDAKRNQTTYNYDCLNRLNEVINPLGYRSVFNCDPAGNRISTIDYNGNTINYSYDANNRLIQIFYLDRSFVDFTYDAMGKRISMTDAQGTTTYTYDELNRLIIVDGPQANDTLSYAYDSVGNRISLTDQDNKLTTYTYDALNRLVKLTDSESKLTTYSYDEVSNLTSMTYPNNTEVKYSFDKLNRLVELVNKSKQVKEWDDKGRKRQPPILPKLEKEERISSYTYSYDQAGMRTKLSLKIKVTLSMITMPQVDLPKKLNTTDTAILDTLMSIALML